MIAVGAVFLDALGPQAQHLHPELRRQLAAPAAPKETVRGVFTTAGVRFARVTRILVPLLGAGLMLTRSGTDIPFTLTSWSRRARTGMVRLDGIRSFEFPDGVQVIVDYVIGLPEPRLVRSVLGARRTIEADFDCAVTDHGTLRLSSRAVRLRAAGMRLRVPRLLAGDIVVEDGWDAEQRRRRINMRMMHPFFGTVMWYRGWYLPPDACETVDQPSTE